MQTALDRLLNLTADQILDIGVEQPEALFEPDPSAIDRAFRALSKKWFPDFNSDPQAVKVQQRLNDLRKNAKEKLAQRAWQLPGYFSCALTNGKTFRVRSDASHKFDLGTMHIGPTTVTYVVNRDYGDLFSNALAVFKAFSFPDDRVREVYEPSLPMAFKTYDANDGLILTVRKKPEDILMRDLVRFIPEKNLDKHVAWIMSRLHEMARYLDYVQIVHNAITFDNVFISPVDHTVGLFGGWWYAAPVSGTLGAVPEAAEPFMRDETLETGVPDPMVDLEMIRAVGRELLGDRGGTRLPFLNNAPEAMVEYLRLPSSGDAQKDLSLWYQKVLPKSFGPRRFIELPVRYRDVYPTKGVQP